MAMEFAQRAIVINNGSIFYDGVCDNLSAQFAQFNQPIYQ
jgi:ABC-type phosphate/phosphonate transport system ATPase subunit